MGSVERVIFFVEEPSMEAFLGALLPRILVDISHVIHPFQCKTEMMAHLPERLRGYRRWIPNSWRIVVLIDRDDDDCSKLKKHLESFASDAGFKTRSQAKAGQLYTVINRVAIEELEAWYFGDWNAVTEAYPRVARTIPKQAKYRDPDAIAGGTWEAFERILRKKKYFQGGLRKIEAARTLAPLMDPSRNSSPSFQAFHAVLAELMAC